VSAAPALHAFSAFGIELEYMVVDRESLSVLPVADELLRRVAGCQVSELRRGDLAWSNEFVLHLIELKNPQPDATLEPLAHAFQAEVRQINRLLEPLGGRLMPAAMHPWMDPRRETRLWPHGHAEIYRSYDRIFDCARHGWANLQCMHVNLPFADDDEFARLHAAARLVLPILPALAASSPVAEGRPAGFADFRMEVYRTHPIRIPSVIGQVIPETATGRAEYETRVLGPMYRDIAPLDPQGILRHEWLNCHGAIARFDRNAIEIRVIDLQECPQADLAIAAAAIAVIRRLYEGEDASLEEQQALATDTLAGMLFDCVRGAERAIIENTAYLRLLGFPGRRCEAGELWRHLVEEAFPAGRESGAAWREPLALILDHGPLARRILRALGSDFSRQHLRAVWRSLCDCLEDGRMFSAADR
jgi:gamma-glutamyl:cysteine ligase YbdK (ATP-grasp superfamily)